MALRPATPAAATAPQMRTAIPGPVHSERGVAALADAQIFGARAPSGLFMTFHSDFYAIHISRRFRPSRFFMTFDPILRLRSLRPLLL